MSIYFITALLGNLANLNGVNHKARFVATHSETLYQGMALAIAIISLLYQQLLFQGTF